MDGGACYFQIEFNVEKKSYRHLRINGEASPTRALSESADQFSNAFVHHTVAARHVMKAEGYR
jgi:hypothetical protein